MAQGDFTLDLAGYLPDAFPLFAFRSSFLCGLCKRKKPQPQAFLLRAAASGLRFDLEPVALVLRLLTCC